MKERREKRPLFFGRLAEEAETKMKKRREGGWMGEIGQINRRTTGSRGGRRHWGEGELTVESARYFFGVESSRRGLFLLLVASFYFRCDWRLAG